MQPSPTPAYTQRILALRRFVSLVAAIPILVAILVLIGWGFDISAFKRVLPGLQAMVPLTAVGLLLAGAALWLLRLEPVPTRRRRIGQICAGLAAAIGGLTLLEYVAGVDIGAGRWLFSQAVRADNALYPGLPAFATALCLLLLGSALLAIDSRLAWLMPLLALSAFCIALPAVLGYAYGVASLYRFWLDVPIALHTALVLIVLALGLLAARPERLSIGVITSDRPGSFVARRLLPAAILLPFGLGWLWLAGQSIGLYDASFSLALFATSQIVVFAGMIYWTAAQLNQTDAMRMWAEQEIRSLNAGLEQRVAERTAELGATVAKLNTLFEVLPVGVSITNGQRQLMEFNPALSQILKLSEHDLRAGAAAGRTYIHADGTPMRSADFASARVVEEHRPIHNVETGIITEAGETIWTSVSAAPLPFGDLAVVIATADITARKQTEQRLLVAQSRLHRLAEANIIGIAVAGAAGELFEANNYYLDLIGYTREEFAAGQVTWIDLTPPEHLAADYRALAELQETGACAPYEKEYRHRDGSRVWVRIIDTVLPQEDGKILALVQNVTDHKRAEIELTRSEGQLTRQAEDLRRSNADLEQFAYVASHDLQEPLRMVTSYVQLLQRRYQGQLDEKADLFIGYAVDGAARMQTLIQDLLAYSRVGRARAELAPTDCARVLEQVRASLGVAIAEAGATIAAGPLPTVLADASQLGQLLQNLISNAVKFHGAEPPQIEICATRQGAMWLFAVRDNGIGIDPRYAERIFVIFQRLHTRAEYPGTGLGLAICKKIVDHHGGQIWLESQPGHGATFSFTLLAVEADPARA